MILTWHKLVQVVKLVQLEMLIDGKNDSMVAGGPMISPAKSQFFSLVDYQTKCWVDVGTLWLSNIAMENNHV